MVGLVQILDKLELELQYGGLEQSIEVVNLEVMSFTLNLVILRAPDLRIHRYFFLPL